MKRYTVDVTWSEVTHHHTTVIVTAGTAADAEAVAASQVRNAAPGRRALNTTVTTVEPVADRAIVTMTPMPTEPPPEPWPSPSVVVPQYPPGRRDHHSGAHHDEDHRDGA